MSINDVAQELADAARYALESAKAIEVCEFHKEVTIRRHDPDAERHAYAHATASLKANNTMFLREDLMAAIKQELDMAADDGCPACASLRDA